MIVTILVYKIISLFLILVAGFSLVRFKVIEADHSRTLSEISLYLICPCVFISAFQIEYTPAVRDGLLLGLGAAVFIHILLISLAFFLEKLLHLRAVEKASIIYTNAGNLIIPIVAAVLGPEWLIYTCPYMGVQAALMWSHGRAIVKGEVGFDIRKIFLNINIVSIAFGLLLFLLDIKIWPPLLDAMQSMAVMIGPCAMLVAGMLIGKMRLGELLNFRRLPLVVLIRLLFLPVLTMVCLVFLGKLVSIPDSERVLLVTLLATVAPSASTIVQMAQVYDNEPQYASAINVGTTMLCILTIPMFVMLYEMFALM